MNKELRKKLRRTQKKLNVSRIFYTPLNLKFEEIDALCDLLDFLFGGH